MVPGLGEQRPGVASEMLQWSSDDVPGGADEKLLQRGLLQRGPGDPPEGGSAGMSVSSVFIHSLTTCFVSTYCVPGTVLDGRNSKINRT